jgi:hypothetical protein
MQVNVTKHAMDQYRRRMQRYSMLESEITGVLRAAAIRGSKIRRCPGDVWEVRFENFVIIASYQEDTAIVITCLGTNAYRNWNKKREIYPRYCERRLG